jgi:uncharacterized membrane protein (TIGR02234 family)
MTDATPAPTADGPSATGPRGSKARSGPSAAAPRGSRAPIDPSATGLSASQAPGGPSAATPSGSRTRSGVSETRGGRQLYARTLLLGLVSAGAVSVGVSEPWVTATATVTGLPVISASVDGADVAPLAGALGFVLLAGLGAVVATRGRVRRGLGVLIVVAAAIVLAAAVHPGDTQRGIEQALAAKGWSGGPYRTGVGWWRVLAAVGGCGCLLSGALVARFGARWASMGARYDAPGTTAGTAAGDLPATPTETDLWRSIDSGHDPTQGP